MSENSWSKNRQMTMTENPSHYNNHLSNGITKEVDGDYLLPELMGGSWILFSLIWYQRGQRTPRPLTLHSRRSSDTIQGKMGASGGAASPRMLRGKGVGRRRATVPSSTWASLELPLVWRDKARLGCLLLQERLDH